MINSQKEAMVIDRICWILLVVSYCTAAFVTYMNTNNATVFVLLVFSCFILAMIVTHMLKLTSYIYKMQGGNGRPINGSFSPASEDVEKALKYLCDTHNTTQLNIKINGSHVTVKQFGRTKRLLDEFDL